MNLDHYQTLGLSPKASQGEIKKAYKSLCQKYHPDKSQDNEEHFKRIRKAYDTLSDPRKKSIYDQGIKSDVNPEEFAQCLEVSSRRIMQSILERLIPHSQLSLIDAIMERINYEIVEKKGQIRQLEKAQKAISKRLATVKKGHDSLLIKELIQENTKISSGIKTGQVVLAVLSYIKEDSSRIEVEEAAEERGPLSISGRTAVYSRSDTPWTA